LVKWKEEEKKRRRKTGHRTTPPSRCCMAPYPIGRSHTPFDLCPKLASSIDSVAIPESFRSTQQQKRENRTQTGEYRKDKSDMIIKKFC
jgi:hypothetical protein